jgi:acyl carrier protein
VKVDDRDGQVREIEDFIVELLAGEDGLEPARLHAELSAVTPEMPFDSVRLVAVMAQVEKRYQVRLQADLPTARDMRSIRSFAERVSDAMDAHRLTGAAAPPAGHTS